MSQIVVDYGTRVIPPSPTIIYGNIPLPLTLHAQYLLMKAGLGNGEYPTQQFIDAIKGVPLGDITKEECKRDVEGQRTTLVRPLEAGVFTCDRVTIKNFTPNKYKLELLVHETSQERYVRLFGRH